MVLLISVTAVQSQTMNRAGGIFSCVDARGHHLTSDRPIPECIDREQRELNPSGTTRRRVEPTYTAREQAEREVREQETSKSELRVVEDRRRERALLTRYPNASAHQRAREEALSQIDALICAARKRLAELGGQRKGVDGEMEFYKKDPGKAPPALRRLVEDNMQNVTMQNRFLGEQEDEKKRVSARFDEENGRLRLLWVAIPDRTLR